MLPLVWGSPVSWTQICENWQSTWSPSPGFTFSCPDLPHWHPVVASNTDLWLYQNWPNKCLMLRTWWLLAIHDTEGKNFKSFLKSIQNQNNVLVFCIIFHFLIFHLLFFLLLFSANLQTTSADISWNRIMKN